MTTVYQAERTDRMKASNTSTRITETPDLDAAVWLVEGWGGGAITQFQVTPNQHWREGTAAFHKWEYHSRALWTYEAGKWTQWSIFDGTSTPLNHDRPKER